MKKFLLLAALWPLSAFADPLDDALVQAKARHAPVFVDFYAPWCHSCFFMDKNVLSGTDWDTVKLRAVTVIIDGDSPEGSVRAQQFKVAGYPSYIVLDENGAELGRILGDKPRAQFYQELNPLLQRGAALEQWKTQVTGADEASVRAARVALRGYYERQDYQAGTAWAAALPEPARAALAEDAETNDLLARLTLLSHAAREDDLACLIAAPSVLGGPLSCDRLVELSELQACLSKLPQDKQRQQLLPYKAKLAALQTQVLVKAKGVCNDTRGIVDVGADLYEALGDAAAYQQLFQQGIAYSEKKLKGNYKSDHHLADNLRYYLDRISDRARLDALFPKLIKAYPETYDYEYRYGKNLAKRGLYLKALPYLEKAYAKSYGRNRLWVAQWRAQALMQLKRDAEAKALVAETLKANGPWFEKDVAVLKGVLEGKTPA